MEGRAHRLLSNLLTDRGFHSLMVAISIESLQIVPGLELRQRLANVQLGVTSCLVVIGKVYLEWPVG